MASKTRNRKRFQKNFAPEYASPPWNVREKHDEMIDVLLTGRFPLIELQDYLGVKPTEDEKKRSGRYGYVMGITYLIQMARLNGWPIEVHNIDHVTWVWLPQWLMEGYDEGS